MSARPETLGLSSSRLEAIDRFIQRKYVEPGRMPCGQVLVWRRGETAHFSTFGMADVERKKALKDDTIFRIYSMTKPVTSVAFMMLVEQGLIALDDPVHRYIPEWKDLGVYQGGFMETFRTKRPDRPMLIVDLLRHTSGLTYGFQQSTNVDAAYRKAKIGEIEKHGTLEEMVQKLAKLPLEFSPGTAWNYSVSTDILGYIVGKVSGQKFEDYLRTKIFKPLGMADTDFHVHAGKESRLAACYAATPKGTMDLQDDPAKSPYLEAPSLVSGGGGLVSTASDYLKFCRMLIGGGTFEGTQILSPKTIQLMTTNHLPDGKDLPALRMGGDRLLEQRVDFIEAVELPQTLNRGGQLLVDRCGGRIGGEEPAAEAVVSVFEVAVAECLHEGLARRNRGILCHQGSSGQGDGEGGEAANEGI